MSTSIHPFWAHSPDASTGMPPHLLADHLRSVAELAVHNGRDFQIPGITDLLRSGGLLHDLGKYQLEFQRGRLGYDPISGNTGQSRRSGIDHSSLGASVLFLDDGGHPTPVSKIRNLLAHAIAGHHCGLHDSSEFRARMEGAIRKENRKESLAFAIDDLAELPSSVDELSRLSLAMSMKGIDLLTRMVLSCIVDADRTDTEAHGSPSRAGLRKRPGKSLDELTERLRIKRASFATTGAVNALRQQMFEEAMQAVNLEPGFFRLTMPTGGGKTLTSLEFALRHAQHHGLRRVIYAIPYTSIIEQTAMVFRDALNEAGEENVLEHHSAIEPKKEDANETSLWRSLLTESWDAPVIVTTTVQLFESLFANKTGRIRKLHNITGSVIVLDEVQALPTRFVGPILDMLSELVKRYRVSVVFCTATQPAFNAAAGFDFPGLERARDLVPHADKFFSKMQRVEYDMDVERTTPWDEVAGRMLGCPQVLTIVNLRRHAQDLYGLVRAADPTALHLSTYMYPAHRRDVLTQIRQRLARKEPCRVVSTQLIECGVDVDFPRVFRVIGPLDSIVQAAGRCNREGELKDATGKLVKGRVWVFRPEGVVAPKGDYLVKVAEASALLADSTDLSSPSIFETYFQRVFQHTDSANLELQRMREKQQFDKVAETFRFIDADTVPAVVTCMVTAEGRVELEEPRQLLKQLESGTVDDPTKAWRQLQMYSVGLRRNQISVLAPLLRRVMVGGKEEMELYEWIGTYTQESGLEFQSDAGRYIA